jgi:signal transduction histidine kinase
MDQSFGEGYISKVTSRQEQNGEVVSSPETVRIAGDVALDRLKYTLIVLNGVLVFAVPWLAWLLTSRTLRPIENTYAKQRQFVSDASHELRTPLTIMQGELDVTLKKDRSVGEYQASLKSTREEVKRLHALTDALLFVARSDQRSARIKQNEVDLTDVLTEVVSRLGPLAATKRITVRFEPPAAKLVVSGSEEMLKQLFTNLAENAIKFTKKAGQVSVSAEPTAHIIDIYISDTGIGMTKQAVSRAFDRFYRADEARHQSGFGLGLSICKAIVEEHSGSIGLESKVGHGTTVKVSLPRL